MTETVRLPRKLSKERKPARSSGSGEYVATHEPGDGLTGGQNHGELRNSRRISHAQPLASGGFGR
jgi:hypothetical protein